LEGKGDRALKNNQTRPMGKKPGETFGTVVGWKPKKQGKKGVRWGVAAYPNPLGDCA